MEVLLPGATWCTVFPPCFSPGGERNKSCLPFSFFPSLLHCVSIPLSVSHCVCLHDQSKSYSPSISPSLSLPPFLIFLSTSLPRVLWRQRTETTNTHPHKVQLWVRPLSPFTWFVFLPCKLANTLWVQWRAWNAFNVLLSCRDGCVFLFPLLLAMGLWLHSADKHCVTSSPVLCGTIIWRLHWSM